MSLSAHFLSMTQATPCGSTLGSSVLLSVKFLEKDGDEQKAIPIFARRARGLMARWMADNRPHTVADLSKCNLEGYGLMGRLIQESLSLGCNQLRGSPINARFHTRQ